MSFVTHVMWISKVFKIVPHRVPVGDFGFSRRLSPGFTLLEVMISMAVIAVVMLAVYRLHSQTVAMNASMRFYTIAPLLARQTMSRTVGSGLKEIGNQSGDFGEDYPGWSWEASVSTVSAAALGNAGDDLRQVDVIVHFRGEGLRYRLRAYRTVRG